MIRLVPAHHPVAADAPRDGVHDRPLGRGDPPASLGLFLRQLDDLGQSYIRLQAVVFDENAAPDHFTRLADAFDRSAAQREVHRRLAFAYGARIPADQVVGWDRARNFEHPDELFLAAHRVGLAIA